MKIMMTTKIEEILAEFEQRANKNSVGYVNDRRNNEYCDGYREGYSSGFDEAIEEARYTIQELVDLIGEENES